MHLSRSAVVAANSSDRRRVSEGEHVHSSLCRAKRTLKKSEEMAATATEHQLRRRRDNNPVVPGGGGGGARGGGPEYTEFGIKIHKLRLTLKVQRRSPSHNRLNEDDERGNEGNSSISGRRPRSSSSSSLSDSLRLLDLDSNAGSRRPVGMDSRASAAAGGGTRLANWEFEGFYSPPVRTSTPSSGYSSAAVSRTSSFSSDVSCFRNNNTSRTRRLTSAGDDSAYSEVYSTIEELAELADPFDNNEEEEPESNTLKAKKQKQHKSMSSLLQQQQQQQQQCHHQKTKSNASLLEVQPFHQKTKSSCSLMSDVTFCQKSHSWSSLDIAPPLPPRTSKCRPPARPPYPSSLVRAVQVIAEPINR